MTNLSTSRIAPDPDRIEDALTRIHVAADMLDTLAEVLHKHDERYGRMLGLIAGDLTEARDTIYPVVGHLIGTGRDAA